MLVFKNNLYIYQVINNNTCEKSHNHNIVKQKSRDEK